MEPTCSWIDPVYAVGWSHSVGLVSVRGRVTVPHLVKLQQVLEPHRAKLPRHGLLTVSSVEVPMPDNETRELAAKQLREPARNLVALALVLEGDGFKASTARAVSAGIVLLARPSVPYKVFGSLEEALRSLAGPLALSAAEQEQVAHACRALRRHHEAFRS